METKTLLFILLAGIAALVLALFQYIYKSKKDKLHGGLAFLRFLTYFFVLLLLINPKFEKTTFYNEKPNLVVALDNSESIRHLNRSEEAARILNTIKNDQGLSDQFNLSYYTFGASVKPLDSLSFDEVQSNVSALFSDLDQVYKDQTAPMVIISDGNQTYGQDYEYTFGAYKQPIYTVVLGDTLTYSDLKIQQLNVNKYAYHKNRFPVELFVNYNGESDVNSTLIISSGGSTVYSQVMRFSPSENTKTVNITLPASNVGVSSYIATIVPLDNEKNTINNSKPFAVEVIDQKTNVALVTAITHPDLGAIKKSIESNEQRTVTITSPSEFLRTKDNFQLAILYQPDFTFRSVFEALDGSNNNRFIIAGTETHWSFLNNIQSHYKQEITAQSEDFQPELNTGYSTFIVDDIEFSTFPPLRSVFGETTINLPYQTVLYKRINGTILEDPLLLTFEENNRREALLLGEDLWKWRAQSYLNVQSFQHFDNFFGKLVQYLASDKQRQRLNLDYQSFYNGNGNIIVTAQFFNKNYEFDNKASIEVRLKHKETNQARTLPFVIKQNNYEVDLSGLEAGEYDFTVRANSGEATRSGAFTVLDFNVEQQFLNADVTKLETVATNSGGSNYFADQLDNLITDLNNDNRFTTIQKNNKNIVPLIDFKYLLALIALALALEWFIRKYNGLI